MSSVITSSLLTIPEVAINLKVKTTRAYALARKGVIPVVRIGRQVRVDPEQLRQFVADGGTRKATEAAK